MGQPAAGKAGGKTVKTGKKVAGGRKIAYKPEKPGIYGKPTKAAAPKVTAKVKPAGRK